VLLDLAGPRGVRVVAASARLWQVDTDNDAGSGGRPASGPFVIGAQMAAAREAEARHQAEPHGPSPLAGVAYEQGLSLIRFTQVPADEMIDEFVGRFAVSSGQDRAWLRSALTMDDFYTLLGYARRAAVRAMRGGDGEVAARGVAALAVVDPGRIDARDLAWQAALLSYALGRVGGDVTGPFERAASLAVGDAAALLGSQADRPVASLSDWGFREIRTDAGVGLVEDEGRRYRPRSDLAGLAGAVAAGVEDGTWRLSDPVIGSDLPAVWLRAGKPGTAEKAIRSITGCVRLRGSLARRDSPGAKAQHMLVFLAETDDPRAAGVIAGSAGPGDGGSFAAVGVSAGTLCAVLIARSFVRCTPRR
jgi:hypothetical protein